MVEKQIDPIVYNGTNKTDEIIRQGIGSLIQKGLQDVVLDLHQEKRNRLHAERHAEEVKKTLIHVCEIVKEMHEDGALCVMSNRTLRKLLFEEFGNRRPFSKDEVLTFALNNSDVLFKILSMAPKAITNPDSIGGGVMRKLDIHYTGSTRMEMQRFDDCYNEDPTSEQISDYGRCMNKKIEEGGDGLYLYEPDLTERYRERYGYRKQEKLYALENLEFKK